MMTVGEKGSTLAPFRASSAWRMTACRSCSSGRFRSGDGQQFGQRDRVGHDRAGHDLVVRRVQPRRRRQVEQLGQAGGGDQHLALAHRSSRPRAAGVSVLARSASACRPCPGLREGRGQPLDLAGLLEQRPGHGVRPSARSSSV